MSDPTVIPLLTPLIAVGEPPAVTVVNAEGPSDFVLVCDHASNAIPLALGQLGLSENELAGHIAWDIGAAGVARQLSERLGAVLVLQNYSRLVIDCNRPLQASDSITTSSEWTSISANENLPEAAIASRISAVFQPYHEQLQQILDERRREGRSSLLIAVHSFTPTYRGTPRPWEISIMYNRDARLAKALLQQLARDKRLVVGDNEPYSVSDDSDYTLPVHGEARRIPHVGIEIRQDLIANELSQTTWAGRLSSLLQQAAKDMAVAG